MAMIRFAVVEDDPDCQRTIVGYIHDYFADRKEVDCAVFNDGSSLLAADFSTFDIIFLDIVMQHSNGIEVAHKIRETNEDVVIIFVTEAVQYAIEGYSVSAADFLVKPVYYTSFCTSMERALNLMKRRRPNMLQINFDKTVNYVDIASIYYIETDTKNKSTLVHAQSGDYRCTDTMRDLEEKLAPYGFGRCHQAYIVNVAYVESVKKDEVLVHGQHIPLSRSRREDFIALLLKEVGSTI